MSYSGEAYRYNTGCHCERCPNKTKDRDSRLVVIEATGTAAYLCIPCVREILALLEMQVNNPNLSWTMSKGELVQWMVSTPRSKPHIDVMRNVVSDHAEDLNEMLKKLQDFKDGYTDRNVFIRDIRKKHRQVFTAIEEYLRRST